VTWHIVRKDLRLLWPLVALVAIAQVVNVILQTALGHFGEPPALAVVGQAFPYVVWIAMVLLIAAAVHQDVLPGVTQDWLVRPIRRRDLLHAKLLFVLITGHVPMFLADVAHSAAEGFSFEDGVRAAVVHAVLVVVVLDVPVFAIATLTRNTTEVLVSFVVMWLVVLLVVGVGVAVHQGAPPPFASTGMQWMTPVFWSLVAFVAALAVVPLQYFRRATKQGRMVVASALLVAPTLSFSSWDAAFSVQQWLSPKPDLARTIAVGFDPRSARPFGDGAEVVTNTALLPLLISGAEPDSIVASDRTVIRLIDGNGELIFAGTTTGGQPRDDFHVRVGSESEIRTRQRIVLPEKIYRLARSTSVRAELDYSLTLFQHDAATAIGATNGSARSKEFGWCRTQIDQDGDDVEVGCLALGGRPQCIGAMLENAVTGDRNPERLSCVPDYIPFSAHVFPDTLSRFSGGVKFRDPHGLTRFPVDGSQLAVARVRLTSYRPVAHFTRHVVIPELQPADWVPPTRAR
jgi:hypothetical protein